MSVPFADFFRKSNSQSPIQPISPAQAKAKLADSQPPLLLDVRTPDEYHEGHIPGSRLLPLQELAARRRELPADFNAPLIVYCRSGARSSQAASMLARMGYQTIYDLGGILSWPYAVERGR